MEDFDFSQLMQEAKREYLNFIDDGEEENVYVEKVKEMIEDKSARLDVSINDLRRKYPERAKNLLENPFEELIAFRKALKEFVSFINPAYATLKEEFYVAFSGSFGKNHVSPRFLTSQYLGKMVCLEGIVATASAVRPKLVHSVHYCPATGKCIERKYVDTTSFAAVPSSSVYPTKDDDGNLLEIEYGHSRYIDHQILTVQEIPENSLIGRMPCSVDIVCEADLADKCKPGDRVLIVGHYKSLPNKQNRYVDGFFSTLIMANNIIEINKDMDTTITVEDVRMCKRLARSKTVNVFDLLSKSLAPSIYGHDYVKKGILCLMFGGVEKILPSETRLRGDINVLLVGDPSVAKSQLLRYVLQTAPRAITTTGRGSSGVGLTAAVTTDPETKDRRLEAGAMVQADRGVVCIDEFDKMSDVDRTAIHEVMEQGKVTINKAGVHATLNARCSVLAAANPVYGRYDEYKTPMENIGFQDSLLSRFDLLFVMLDIADPVQDDVIAEHVLRMHTYRHPQEKDGEVIPSSSGQRLSTKNLDHDEDEDLSKTMYEKYDPLLHGGTRSKTDKILSTTFMRKFIRIGRLLKPKLTQEASDILAEEYVRLRSQDYHTTDTDVARTLPVTARTLETLIRLSTAHAKCRMSGLVTKEDAMVAIKLVQFAYFKKVLTKEKRRAPDDDEQPSTSKAKKAKGKKGPEDKDTEEDKGTSDNEAEVLVQAAHTREPESSERPSTSSETTIEANRLNQFMLALNELFKSERANSLPLRRVSNYVNEEYAHAPFTSGEINAAIHTMVQANQVMFADDIIFLI